MQWVSHSRRAQGLTQDDLARETGLSLASIQKIEAGRGNPSFRTLQSIAEVLDVAIRFEERKSINWSRLIAHGLPLLDANIDVDPLSELSISLLKRDLLRVPRFRTHLDLRQKEALVALVVAMKIHYPSVFKKLTPRVHRLERIATIKPQLVRIALEGLAKYL